MSMGHKILKKCKITKNCFAFCGFQINCKINLLFLINSDLELLLDETIICIHTFLLQCDYSLHQARLKSLVQYIDC